MKKLNFLLSSLLLCMCCTIQAKNKVIEQPPFVVSNTTSIEVNQVEISDTATVLHIFAKYRPKNWIKLLQEVTCKIITERLTNYVRA